LVVNEHAEGGNDPRGMAQSTNTIIVISGAVLVQRTTYTRTRTRTRTRSEQQERTNIYYRTIFERFKISFFI
jgi:hypothetical protein